MQVPPCIQGWEAQKSMSSLQVGPVHPGVQLQENVSTSTIVTSEHCPPFEHCIVLQGSAKCMGEHACLHYIRTWTKLTQQLIRSHSANLRAGGNILNSTSLSSVEKGPGRVKLKGCSQTVKECFPGGMGLMVLNTTWLVVAPRAPRKSNISFPVPLIVVMNSTTSVVSSSVGITSIVNKYAPPCSTIMVASSTNATASYLVAFTV